MKYLVLIPAGIVLWVVGALMLYLTRKYGHP